jgi:hypothetical protein
MHVAIDRHGDVIRSADANTAHCGKSRAGMK